ATNTLSERGGMKNASGSGSISSQAPVAEWTEIEAVQNEIKGNKAVKTSDGLVAGLNKIGKSIEGTINSTDVNTMKISDFMALKDTDDVASA
ncbi:hypothetical protein ACFL5G_05900, partial [Candidatus Margulisiibacteriota bacterium]